MNTKVEGITYAQPVPELNSRGIGLFQLVGGLYHAAVDFFKGLKTAQVAAHRARRYYAMSDSQLASEGLTRDQIALELVRILVRG